MKNKVKDIIESIVTFPEEVVSLIKWIIINS